MNGGVLEHPRGSKLWLEEGLPMPGEYDQHKGYTICVDQFWWGHKAKKNTLLYIVGCPQNELPPIPLRLDAIEYTVQSRIRKGCGKGRKKDLPKSQRELTPHLFAKFLVEIAEKAYFRIANRPNGYK